MKAYLFRFSEKDEKVWLAMRVKAIQMGISVKQAIVQAITLWAKEKK